MPEQTWGPALNGDRCPTCGAVLEERGGEFKVLERPDPVRIVDGDRRCPAGHELPDDLR